MDAAKQKELNRRLTQIDPDAAYYAHTLTAAADGQVQWETQSEWVGQGSKRMWELRTASKVDPAKMRDLWSAIGQPSIVVNDTFGLLMHYRYGGNAVVSAAIVEEWLPYLLRRTEYVPGRPLSHPRSLQSAPSPSLARRPSPKLRMDVLRRDDFRCAACRRRDGDNVDFRLHVHHIRPFADGGLTEYDNLITLCQTCHEGLDPHLELRLLDLMPGGLPVGDLVAAGIGSEFRAGVVRYRESSFSRAAMTATAKT